MPLYAGLVLDEDERRVAPTDRSAGCRALPARQMISGCCREPQPSCIQRDCQPERSLISPAAPGPPSGKTFILYRKSPAPERQALESLAILKATCPAEAAFGGICLTLRSSYGLHGGLEWLRSSRLQ